MAARPAIKPSQTSYVNTYLFLDLPRYLFFKFPHKILFAFLFVTIWATCTTHLLFLDVMTRIIFGEWHRNKRLGWLGHVERMINERVAKTINKWKPYETKLKRSPRVRWEDDVRNDLRKMGVSNWKQRTQERKQWKEIIEQAKTHKELYSWKKKKSGTEIEAPNYETFLNLQRKAQGARRMFYVK